MKFALPLSDCTSYGVAFAAHGLRRTTVINRMVKAGFSKNGLTLKRVLKAYDEQKARG